MRTGEPAGLVLWALAQDRPEPRPPPCKRPQQQQLQRSVLAPLHRLVCAIVPVLPPTQLGFVVSMSQRIVSLYCLACKYLQSRNR